MLKFNFLICNFSYQINAGTELAKKFHNISPLENHHKESAFKILSHPETNIFNACTIEEHKRIEDVSLTRHVCAINDPLGQTHKPQSHQ